VGAIQPVSAIGALLQVFLFKAFEIRFNPPMADRKGSICRITAAQKLPIELQILGKTPGKVTISSRTLALKQAKSPVDVYDGIQSALLLG